MFDLAAVACPPVAASAPPRRRSVHAAPIRTGDEAHENALLADVALRRDERAFERLYALHVSAATRAALHICRDASVAEEIAQHVFVALWTRADRLLAKSVRLRPWLATVARNAAIDHLRTGRLGTIALDDCGEPVADTATPERRALDAETAREVRAAMRGLCAEQRAAIELVFFSGLTYRGAAETAGLPLGTLKSRVRLALGHLRMRIAPSTLGL